jgi:DNA-3-methyladenine glycosylase II
MKRDLPKVKELLAFGERWRPHRTTAAWYLWQAANGARQKDGAAESKLLI